MSQEKIDKFNSFSHKVINCNIVDIEHFEDNLELTRERLTQLFYSKYDSDEDSEAVIERFKTNPIVNYLDLIFFDLLDISRTEKLQSRIKNGMDIFEFLKQTNFKAEFILYVFDKFHEDYAIRMLLIEHIKHLHIHYNWLEKPNITGLIESTDLSQSKVDKCLQLVETYTEILKAIKVYYSWYTTPHSIKIATEIEPIKHNYKYLKVNELEA